ncbi:MAG TPA: lysylphosphatidylglycerol synthase transmembrane domain-containing protein [Anaerolineales bacterium]
MRKFILILVLFLGVALVILSFGELQTIVQTLQQANFWFVLLALSIEGVWFLVVGRMYRSVFKLLGMEDTTRNLTLIAAAVTFVNTVTPMAGFGGIALFAAEARRRGQPSGKATVAGPLFLLFDQAAFLIILALGMFVLFRRNHLGAGEITAAFFLLAIACVIALFLYLGYRSADKMGSLLARMAAFINRIAHPLLHRDYLSEERAHLFAEEIGEGLSGLTQKPSSLLEPVLFGLLGKVLLMCVLACSFLAFEVPFTAGTIVGGFSVGYLFLIVSPTPSGIGVVEGVMALALTSLRVVWSQSVIITLVYRAITFWVPLGVGAVAFRRLH